ncbi:MAG TPA: hypothetical protein VFG09_11095 [Thermodesulfovibrionales bacterium]|nr:hypothetical protein [Thermodesulfovibrionales bacterium]
MSRIENGDKIFPALFDLQINIVSLLVEVGVIGDLEHKFEAIKGTVRSLYESHEVFSNRMDAFRHQFSVILRYRAIWDKFMGLIIMRFLPDKYDAYMKAKSKKKDFITITSKVHIDTLFKPLIDAMMEFDDEFRTTEAHFTGRIRKWTFTSLGIHASPSLRLIHPYIGIHLRNMLSLLKAAFN